MQADPDTDTAERLTAAARDALGAYALRAPTIELVSMSENASFRVVDEEGSTFVLRLHRPGYQSAAALRSERTWTRALGEAGIAAPVPVDAADGRAHVETRVPGEPVIRLAGLARWIDGEIMAARLTTASGDDLRIAFERLGKLIARLHDHTERWRPPADFFRLALDADGLMGEAPHWGRFWEHPDLNEREAAIFKAARDQLRASLRVYGRPPDAFGLIHADLHPGNVLVQGDGLGIIDFDDAGYGWHMYDIAVSLLAYAARPDFEDIAAALLRGYLSVRTLDAAHWRRLPMFLTIRRLAQIGWLMQRPEIAIEPARFRALAEDAAQRIEAGDAAC